MADNPYAAPRTRVDDVQASLAEGDFIAEGRGVPAGHGWRWIADAWTFMGDQRWTFIGVVLACDQRRDHARLRGGEARRAARSRIPVRRLPAPFRQARGHRCHFVGP